MRDIKLTLGRRPNRAPSVGAEARRMKTLGPLYYPLGANGPKHAAPGCWVYFIRAGELVGRAKAKTIEWIDPPIDGYDAAEQPSTIKGWQVTCTKMELASRPIPTEGFQAFRYVTAAEGSAFERAFSETSGSRPVRGTRKATKTRRKPRPK